MRFIKLGLLSAIVLFIVLLALSLLIPFHIRISRAININASQNKIYRELSDVSTWKKWNELLENNEIKVRVISSSRDSVLVSWKKSNNEEIPGGFNIIEWVRDTTVVQWYFDFHLKWYPWEKFRSIIYDKQLGPPMEKSLDNLKNLVENSP